MATQEELYGEDPTPPISVTGTPCLDTTWLATDAEAQAGVLTTKVITPANLHATMMKIPVEVTADWTVGTNVAADIATATGFVVPPETLPFALGNQIIFIVWLGPSNPNAYSRLICTDPSGGGTMTFEPFTVMPNIGDIVYLIGVDIVILF